MNSSKLDSLAEREAKKAEELEAFSSLKLEHVKSQVEELHDLIGNEGIFDEYTKHDINHINGMLENLEWIIPDETKNQMTSTDWLMVVLSTYFHDLGLLVTRKEFKNRNETEFRKFVEQKLFSEDEGEDYKERIESVPKEKRERFLYQEFVRINHPKRIKKWIEGNLDDEIGGTHEVIDQIDDLLGDLPKRFRKDLALICESHHRNDLDDTDKYRTSQPYGKSKDTTVNLQYCAILLRTADLLHITSDRAPSIAFRIIDPADPKGQEEWAKQEAVYNIRSKPETESDKEDQAEKTRTIEVHAFFDDEKGFFSLISYLDYAEDQIKQCHQWNEEAKSSTENNYLYPWSKIDKSNIETEGFERETFEFSLDQERILDLLTGHTLYNDTDVAVRELVQNSIDAIRLKSKQTNKEIGKTYEGKIRINWDSDERILEVKDNGTGMTQEIIENHLLKVGSSRYQGEKFKEDFPNFNAISEFGIGILSTFMIANEVEILTCHEDEDAPRQISFRSVHGRYLVRHIEEGDPEYNHVSPHGTLVRLKLRPSADLDNIKDVCEKWFVTPPCDIELNVDDNMGTKIGHDNLTEALENFLDRYENELPRRWDRDQIKVRKKEYEGVEVCYAVGKSDVFQDWRLIKKANERIPPTQRTNEWGPLGISIEGIRVTTETPGFRGKPFIAMANLTGQQRPRTNVARTDLKTGKDFQNALNIFYKCYYDHVKEEIDALHKEREYSLSWALQESRYIMKPLQEGEPTNREIKKEISKTTPLYLIEENGERKAESLSKLRNCESLWTLDSPLLRRADQLFRDLPNERSYHELVQGLELPHANVPNGPILCDSHSQNVIDDSIFREREPSEIRIHQSDKRVDVKWTLRQGEKGWVKIPEEIPIKDSQNTFLEFKEILLQMDDTGPEQLNGKTGVVTGRRLFLLQNTPFSDYLHSKVHDARQADQKSLIELTIAVSYIDQKVSYNLDSPASEQKFKNRIREHVNEIKRKDALDLFDYNDPVNEFLDVTDLYRKITATEWDLFNPDVWFRRFEED